MARGANDFVGDGIRVGVFVGRRIFVGDGRNNGILVGALNGLTDGWAVVGRRNNDFVGKIIFNVGDTAVKSIVEEVSV